MTSSGASTRLRPMADGQRGGNEADREENDAEAVRRLEGGLHLRYHISVRCSTHRVDHVADAVDAYGFTKAARRHRRQGDG